MDHTVFIPDEPDEDLEGDLQAQDDARQAEDERQFHANVREQQ